MDISEFASTLLAQSESLLREWLPAGKKRGREYVCGSLAGEPGESLSVNLETGLWADFSNPELRGGDLVSLYAAQNGLKQGEAAKKLGWLNGSGHAAAAPAKALQPSCQPIPADAPPLPGPAPAACYSYRDAAGVELFRIARYEPEGERKSFKPWTWRGKWTAKAYPAPRPLYGLELLGDKPVLVVEGEKACDAARQIMGASCHVLTWAGGAAAVNTVDWSPLYGRRVAIWPDADKPGKDAALAIGAILLPHRGNAELAIHDQDGMPDGWDMADALADGWTRARVAEHMRRDNWAHRHILTAPDLQKGRPHDGKAPVATVEPAGTVSIRGQIESLGLQCNSGGIPYPNEDNAERILMAHPQFAGKLWTDCFAQKLQFGDALFTRNDAVRAMIFIQGQLGIHKMPLAAIERAAPLVGAINQRHPIREWLSALKWDGIPRLASLMADGFGTAQNDYTAAVGRCWLTSMVARVFEPGCKADLMPVFEGPQGIRKSTAMRTIGGKWFMESHEDPIHNRKDFLLGLQGHWLIEIPEMHAIAGRGAGIEKIKGIISNVEDFFRIPYGHDVAAFPRQCIFAGTTNQDQWNPDPTGGRRFLPIACGTIEIGYLQDQREQLFAEAVAEYRRTHDWYSVPVEAARDEQDARRERDAWEDLILPWLAGRPGSDVTIAQVLTDVIGIEPGHWKQVDQNRVARALRSNGWYRWQVRSGNVRSWVYRNSRRNEPAPVQEAF